jgi:hypothetical protein
MSALPPKADILRCGKERRYSITSSARASIDCGIVRPSEGNDQPPRTMSA